MNARGWARMASVAAALHAVPPALAAQYDACRPGAESNEAKTLAIFSVPLAFSQGAPPGSAHTSGGPVGVTIGLEASSVPSVVNVPMWSS